jgi:hypothetical protein
MLGYEIQNGIVDKHRIFTTHMRSMAAAWHDYITRVMDKDSRSFQIFLRREPIILSGNKEDGASDAP